MKRSILAVILALSAAFCAFGQNSDTIDLVLLLDTSSGMVLSYEKVNDYITGSFLSEFLKVGDTFHLISFSASPRLDIARRISSKGDIETIIGRMLIQYPVETGNDVKAAVNYVEAYISTLPPRPKKIIMVSSGGSDTNSIVSAAKQRLSSKNATLDFVSVTGGQGLVNLPSSGRSPSRQTASQQGPSSGTTAAPAGTTPTGAGASATPPAGSAPPASAQGTSVAQAAAQGSSQTSTQDAPLEGAQTATRQPASSNEAGSSAQGVSSSDDGRQASDKNRDSQQDSSAAVSGNAASAGSARKKGANPFNPTILLIIGIIAAILLLILLIVFVSRRLGSSPNRVMASVSASSHEKDDKFTDHSRDLANYAASQNKKRFTPYSDRPVKGQILKQLAINPDGPLLLNLFVEDQNTSIGKRNIHSLKSGYNLSVGGGSSDDFMIFLVPMPSRLGEIRRNGSQLSFVPRKHKYFPDIGSNEVIDCINKRIRIVSDKNYEMWFSFVMYEDPLEELNRVLRSIKVPG